jgi:hypothetical protein
VKVTRIITYEGSPELLEKQLGQSMADGKKTGFGAVSITVTTLPSRWGIWRVWKALRGAKGDEAK